MKENFAKVQPHVLAYEGGYSNHPRDPGGATMNGVTQRVYHAYLKNKGKPPRSVKHLTPTEREEIYKAQYWDRVQGDRLPAGLDFAVYDFAVNSGISRSAKYLQKSLGVTQDGVIGEMTLAALDGKDAGRLARDLCDARLAFVKRLKTWPTFGRGWSRRIASVRKLASEMAAGAKSEPVEPHEETAKAEGKASLWRMIVSFLRGLTR